LSAQKLVRGPNMGHETSVRWAQPSPHLCHAR
jgi:hypothetical protein